MPKSSHSRLKTRSEPTFKDGEKLGLARRMGIEHLNFPAILQARTQEPLQLAAGFQHVPCARAWR